MEKLKLHSPDLTAGSINKIAALFPQCVVEAKDDNGKLARKVDFDQLRQELSDSIVEGPQERYRLDWPGKRESLLAANAPIAKTLRPCREESVDFDTTQNLFIEGDNLDALKLLQETYLGKVKMIYIDPPYNTGHDFVYEDDFAENTSEYLLKSNQHDEGQNRLVANNESNGRFHSDWLSMMYSRLKLARNLLSENGAIFITIDDCEAHSLKKICDEIFGEGNFIANAVWRSKDNSNNDAKRFSCDHNHILVYSKNQNWEPTKLKDASKQSHFKNPDNDPKGAYFDGNPLNSPNYRENLIYKIESPQGNIIPSPKNGWRWSKAVLQSKIDSGEIMFKKDGTGIRRRTYLRDMKGLPPSSLWTDLDKTGHNRQAKYELLKILPENLFETPKPLKLLKHIIRLADVQSGDLILDFFSGSSTTAHATMQLNAEDGGSRKFMMIQLPEICDEQSNAFKADFRTIADVSKERICRAGKKIKEESETTTADLDIGFRVLKIDTSNAKDIYYTPDAISQEELALQVDHIKEDRTAEDLLFQVMLDWGIDLALPITKETFVCSKAKSSSEVGVVSSELKSEKLEWRVFKTDAELKEFQSSQLTTHNSAFSTHEVYFVDENAIAACFETGINEDFVKELAKREPLRVVFRDTCFESDSAKINVAEIFKLLSPNTDIKTL